jgi:hypothetical protein
LRLLWYLTNAHGCDTVDRACPDKTLHKILDVTSFEAKFVVFTDNAEPNLLSLKTKQYYCRSQSFHLRILQKRRLGERNHEIESTGKRFHLEKELVGWASNCLLSLRRRQCTSSLQLCSRYIHIYFRFRPYLPSGECDKEWRCERYFLPDQPLRGPTSPEHYRPCAGKKLHVDEGQTPKLVAVRSTRVSCLHSNCSERISPYQMQLARTGRVRLLVTCF